jgi:hypothetical protein
LPKVPQGLALALSTLCPPAENSFGITFPIKRLNLTEKVRPDKRRYLRYEILDYAVVRVDGESADINTVIADISLGGVQLRSKVPFAPGQSCTIRVGWHDGSRGLRAEVRYSRRLPDSELFTTGMKFVPESHEDRVAIAEYVHQTFERQCDNLMV